MISMVRKTLLGFPSHTLPYRCRNLITLSAVLGEAFSPCRRERKQGGRLGVYKWSNLWYTMDKVYGKSPAASCMQWAAGFPPKDLKEFSAAVLCIFSQAMWTPRCDKWGLSPGKFQIRSRSGGPPPPRRAMQGPAQAGRLCFDAHFCVHSAHRGPGSKKENQYFYGRKIKNHPPGRSQ